MPTCRLGMFHRRFVLPVLIVMRGLQVMMRRGLILRCCLKVVAVLAAMVSACVLRLVAHESAPAGVS